MSRLRVPDETSVGMLDMSRMRQWELSIGKRDKAKMNPVFEKNSRWYFYDETWSVQYGPYKNKKEAEDACMQYCHDLNHADDSMHYAREELSPQMAGEESDGLSRD